MEGSIQAVVSGNKNKKTLLFLLYTEKSNIFLFKIG